MSYQESFRTKPLGYIVHGHKQGIIGVVLAMNAGTLVHLRYEADCSDDRIEQTEFWRDRDLETVATGVEGISISFSDFDLAPIVLASEQWQARLHGVRLHQDAIKHVASVALTAEEDETFVQVLDFLADEPEHWSEELKVLARIYNRLNQSEPYDIADSAKSHEEVVAMSDEEALSEADEEFVRGLDAL